MSGYVGTNYSNSMSSLNLSGQLVNGIGLVAIIFILLLTSEVLYKSIYETQTRFLTLVDYTASSEDMTLAIHQDARKYPDAKTIGLSVNERTGIEFAYSFYIYVFPSTFDGNANFKHVFHKGYGFPWPLMAPGVFFRGDENTMRVLMNTYANPYTYADIKNMPVQKWVHVVLNCIKGGLDIFINGSLASRIPFTNTIPYQNFQDIVLFSNVNSSILGQASTPSALGSDMFPISGAFKGYLSNLKYARYALSINEIQSLMNAGPSSKKVEKVMERPPYLADDWWAGQH
jgi:hypothetical protein